MFFLLQIIVCLIFQVHTNKFPEKQPIHDIPVLCYHEIRDWKTTDTKNSRAYILPTKRFASQMKMLSDSGYQVILVEDLMNYLDMRDVLPHKAVLLTFDDGSASQFENAVPILIEHGYNAVFFIMTVTINKNFYMSTQQIKILSDKGFVIGCHTWDHHSVASYNTNDWCIQMERSKQLLEKITGKTVEYFAYPYGVWTESAITQLKTYNYKAAFQLTGKRSISSSNYTIRRIIVDGSWDGIQLDRSIKRAFK